MSKYLNGRCRVCGGPVEFAAEAAGTTANCPHCGQPTELFLSPPPVERTVPLRTVVYTAVAILILVGGLVAAMIALKRMERITGRGADAPAAITPQPPATPPPTPRQ